MALAEPERASDALDLALDRRLPDIVFVPVDPTLAAIPRSQRLEAVLNPYRGECALQAPP